MAALSEARKRANLKWDKENMTILACRVRKDYAEQVKAKALKNGDTVNGIIRKALDDYMAREK